MHTGCMQPLQLHCTQCILQSANLDCSPTLVWKRPKGMLYVPSVPSSRCVLGTYLEESYKKLRPNFTWHFRSSNTFTVPYFNQYVPEHFSATCWSAGKIRLNLIHPSRGTPSRNSRRIVIFRSVPYYITIPYGTVRIRATEIHVTSGKRTYVAIAYEHRR